MLFTLGRQPGEIPPPPPFAKGGDGGIYSDADIIIEPYVKDIGAIAWLQLRATSPPRLP